MLEVPPIGQCGALALTTPYEVFKKVELRFARKTKKL